MEAFRMRKIMSMIIAVAAALTAVVVGMAAPASATPSYTLYRPAHLSGAMVLTGSFKIGTQETATIWLMNNNSQIVGAATAPGRGDSVAVKLTVRKTCKSSATTTYYGVVQSPFYFRGQKTGKVTVPCYLPSLI